MHNVRARRKIIKQVIAIGICLHLIRSTTVRSEYRASGSIQKMDFYPGEPGFSGFVDAISVVRPDSVPQTDKFDCNWRGIILTRFIRIFISVRIWISPIIR